MSWALCVIVYDSRPTELPLIGPRKQFPPEIHSSTDPRQPSVGRSFGSNLPTWGTESSRERPKLRRGTVILCGRKPDLGHQPGHPCGLVLFSFFLFFFFFFPLCQRPHPEVPVRGQNALEYPGSRPCP